VARIYDDLTRGDISAVVAVLDDHVLWIEGGQVVAVGTTRRVDPVTGQLIAARFRHVWRVIYGRVVDVEWSTVLLPVSQTTDRHTDYH
jgi:hypothetical protein